MSSKLKILISLLSGFMVLGINWLYLNSNFTLGAEDNLYKTFDFFKFRIVTKQSSDKNKFVFINTAKDLALIDDNNSPGMYGNIAVSDREKLQKLLSKIDQSGANPLFIAIDLQFNCPYTTRRSDPGRDSLYAGIDSLLQAEINNKTNITTPVSVKNGVMDGAPIIRANNVSVTDYSTYGGGVNKFQLYYFGRTDLPSMPLYIFNQLDSPKISSHRWFSTCGYHLILNNIWPYYYLTNKNMPGDSILNLGELLTGINRNFVNIKSIVDKKIVVIGNFAEVINNAAGKKSSSPLILADIYLTLHHHHHVISYAWLFLMWSVYGLLSYYSWFERIPKVRLNFNFVFSRHLSDFLKGYLSYFGAMFLCCVISFYLFDLYVNILLPALLFSVIDYIVNKKYKSDES